MVAPRAWEKGILVSEGHRKWTQSWRWQKGRWGHTGSSTEWAELQSPAVTRRERRETETSRLQSLPFWCSLTILHEQGAGDTYWLHCSGQSKGGASQIQCIIAESLVSVTKPEIKTHKQVNNRYTPNPWIQHLTLSFPEPSQTGKRWHAKGKQSKNTEHMKMSVCLRGRDTIIETMRRWKKKSKWVLVSFSFIF